eukprot:6165360-Pyramimonas_sp.AAC.1
MAERNAPRGMCSTCLTAHEPTWNARARWEPFDLAICAHGGRSLENAQTVSVGPDGSRLTGSVSTGFGRRAYNSVDL